MEPVYFDPRRQALAEEIRNHPELVAILEAMHEEQGLDASEFEIRLAATASYCGVGLDGEYLQEELSKLCDILVWKLRDKRSHIITTKPL